MSFSFITYLHLSFALFQEKYEKELRDLRARELMHVEKAAILDKVVQIMVFFSCL